MAVYTHTHTHTHTGFSTTNVVDSARANLSSSFVNGFVNAAFGEDKLLMDDGNKWIYKHKGAGMMSATASLGLILLWDVEGGLTQIDKFLYSNEDYIKVGRGGKKEGGVGRDWRGVGRAGRGMNQLSHLNIYPLVTHMQSGALLACGIVNSGVRNECDPALALLSDYVQHKTNSMRVGAVIG